MMNKKPMPKSSTKSAGKKSAAFKPCPGCPNKAKCTAMGKCMKDKG